MRPVYASIPKMMTFMWPMVSVMGPLKMRKGKDVTMPTATVQPMRKRGAPKSSRCQNRKASMKPQNVPANIIMPRKATTSAFLATSPTLLRILSPVN